MAINRGPWNALVDDDGSNLVGSVWNKAAIKDVLLDPMDAAIAGPWTDVPFSAANFTAGAGSWTVTAAQVPTFAYVISAKTMMIALVVDSSTVAGSPAALAVAMPGGVSRNRRTGQPMSYYNGTAGTGWVNVGTSAIEFYRDMLGTAWANGVTNISAIITINIV